MKKIIKTTSPKWALNLRDVFNSFIAAFVFALIASLATYAETKHLPSTLDEWKTILGAALTGAVLLLLRQYAAGLPKPTDTSLPK